MKLVIDARMINYSGIGRYIKNILDILFEIKDFDIILMGKIEELRNYNCKDIIELKSKPYNPYEHLELFFKIPETDIFWCPHYNSTILPIKAKKRITTIHDVFHITQFSTLNKIKKIYAKFLLKNIIKNSDYILTVSNFTKNEIINYFGNKCSNKIYIIGNYLNKNFFVNDFNNEERNSIFKKYSIEKGFILFVGNVKPHKNIIGTLKAFSIFNNEIKGYKLLIVGQRENLITGMKNLEELIKELNINNEVVFTGILNDKELKMLYKFTEMLLLPSFYEGFGIPPLEAIYYDCPLLLSKIPPLEEIYKDVALFVNPYDQNEIANGIKYILFNKDEFRYKIAKNKDYILKNYSKENIKEKLIKFLNEII